MHKSLLTRSSSLEPDKPFLHHQSSSTLDGMKFLNVSKCIGSIFSQVEVSKDSVSSILNLLRRDFLQGNKKSMLKLIESLKSCDSLLFHRVFLSLEIDENIVYCGDLLETRSAELLMAYADLQMLIQNILDACASDINSYHQQTRSANKTVSGTYFMDLQVIANYHDMMYHFIGELCFYANNNIRCKILPVSSQIECLELKRVYVIARI